MDNHEVSDEMISALKQGNIMYAGIDHAVYQESTEIAENVYQSLLKDFH